MGHKYARAEILRGAMDAAFADGLSQLTFGRVARRLGISDRIVVYYFPSKDDLAREVLAAVGHQLQQTLARAFTGPAADHLALVRVAWPLLARPESDPIFALFFESIGLAVSGREPYRSLVPRQVDAWLTWAASLIDGTAATRRAEAEAAIALIDGLLLIRLLAGARAAGRAARRCGVA